MKKLISLILCLLLVAVPGVSSAELDLSSMSLQELIDLRQQITMAMWKTEEWQEVTVPAGIYKIGEDIPAGRWTISSDEFAYITLGSKLDVYGTSIEYSDNIVDGYLDGDGESVTWNFTEGTYLWIECASVVFTPYAGANLGFKF